MRLSEAILYGSTLRPPSHQERFVNVEGRGLCSDVWGAACEAVAPFVAKLNWNWSDKVASDLAMSKLYQVAHRYFESYFHMPAQCPGAIRRYAKAGGRIINRRGEFKIEGEKEYELGGITNECDKVEHIAGLIDHMYYKHNWSRERCAEAVAWYERTRNTALISNAFSHFQNPVLAEKHNRELLAQARRNAMRRANVN